MIPMREVPIVRAGADTDDAIGILIGPEPETLFCVWRPLHHTFDVGHTVHLSAGRSVGQGLWWAGFGAAITLITEPGNAKLSRLISDQRQIRVDLADAESGAKTLIDQQSVSTHLS